MVMLLTAGVAELFVSKVVGCGCINYHCVKTIIHLINGDVFWYDVVVGWWGRCLCVRIGGALGDCNCKQPTQQSSKLSTKSSNQQCNEPKLEPTKLNGLTLNNKN